MGDGKAQVAVALLKHKVQGTGEGSSGEVEGSLRVSIMLQGMIAAPH